MSSLAHPLANTTSAVQCVQCGIFLSGDVMEHFWWTTPLPLTLNTIKFNITQYNNTAITSQETIHNPNPSFWGNRWDIPQPDEFWKLAEVFGNQYGDVSFLGKDETVITDDKGFIMTSPTAYFQYSRFQYFIRPECLTTNAGTGGIVHFGPFDNASVISLSTTFYKEASGGALDLLNVAGKSLGDIGYQQFPRDFYNYIMSNSILLSSYPFLRTCYTAYAHGVPSVKIRVSTLTASEYNTVTSGGVYTAFMGKTTPTPGIKAAPGPAAKALIPSTTTSPPKLAITSFLQAPDVPQSSQAVSHIANEPESPEPSKENEPEIPGPSKDKGPEIPEPSKNNEPESPGPFKNNEPGNPGSSQDNEPKIPEPSKNGTQNEPSRIQEAPLQNQRPNPANPPGEKLSPQEDSPAPKAVQNQPSAARRPEPKNSGPRIESAESPPKVTGGPNNPGGMSLPTIPLAPNAKTATSRNPSKTDSSDHPLPVIKIGNDIIIAQAASHYIIGSQTLAPGGPIITANNIKYSLAPSATALIVGSQTLLSGGPAIHIKGIPYSLASLTASGDSTVEVDAGNNEPPVLSIAGFAATADSNSNYHVGAQTLAPGSVGITVNGVLYSLAPSATALVSGSSTIALNSAKDKLPSLTIAGATVTANSASNYIIGTQTLVPGAPGITVNGALYSLAPSATALVSGSSTIPLTSGSSDLPNSITIGGSTYTANSASQYIIGSQTLVPGGHPITVSGATYSLSPSATALISNGITVPIPLRTSLPFVITIDGTGYRGNSDSGYVIGSQTLFPNGSPISINATPYSFSLGSSGGALIIGTSTSFLFSAQATQPPQVITLGSSLYTENPSSGFIIGEQTLAPGSAITVDGTAISLGAEGTNLVVGSTTESINLGSLILSAFGGEPTDAAGNPSGGDVAGFTGEANVRSSAQNILWLILVVMLFSMM